MAKIEAISVFCGSREGQKPAYMQEAYRLGHLMAKRNINLVYGGGAIGLMGAVANGVKENGGYVTGVIPDFLRKHEVGHYGLDELIVTESMHERKLKMFELSQAAVILPGGLGTLDEAFEIITWKQLRQHDRPIVIVNQQGYWDVFEVMIDKIIDQGFAHEKVRELYSVVETIDDIFAALETAPEVDDAVLTSHL